MRSRAPLVGIAAAACLFGGRADGQVIGGDETALSGISVVTATFTVTWDDDITGAGGPAETQYERQILDSFELGLLRAGVKTSDANLPYLRCSVHLIYWNNVVSFGIGVSLHEAIGPPGALQGAITWEARGLGHVGSRDLDGAEHGQWCAETFELAWRRANGL